MITAKQISQPSLTNIKASIVIENFDEEVGYGLVPAGSFRLSVILGFHLCIFISPLKVC